MARYGFVSISYFKEKKDKEPGEIPEAGSGGALKVFLDNTAELA